MLSANRQLLLEGIKVEAHCFDNPGSLPLLELYTGQWEGMPAAFPSTSFNAPPNLINTTLPQAGQVPYVPVESYLPGIFTFVYHLTSAIGNWLAALTGNSTWAQATVCQPHILAQLILTPIQHSIVALDAHISPTTGYFTDLTLVDHWPTHSELLLGKSYDPALNSIEWLVIEATDLNAH